MAVPTVKPRRYEIGPFSSLSGLGGVTASSIHAGYELKRATPGPIAAPEPYIDRKQLAELMGVSVATIDRMVRAGMPSETWGIRSRRFLPSVALAWARARELAR